MHIFTFSSFSLSFCLYLSVSVCLFLSFSSVFLIVFPLSFFLVTLWKRCAFSQTVCLSWIILCSAVDLQTVVASDYPLFLDYSPPFAGEVFDGPNFRKQLKFTYLDSAYSSNWDGFYDPQSGIGEFSKYSALAFICSTCPFALYMSHCEE